MQSGRLDSFIDWWCVGKSLSWLMQFKSHRGYYFLLQEGWVRTRLKRWDTLAMKWHLSSPVLYWTCLCFYIATLLHNTKMAPCSFFTVFLNDWILSAPFLKYKELIPVAVALLSLKSLGNTTSASCKYQHNKLSSSHWSQQTSQILNKTRH